MVPGPETCQKILLRCGAKVRSGIWYRRDLVEKWPPRKWI